MDHQAFSPLGDQPLELLFDLIIKHCQLTWSDLCEQLSLTREQAESMVQVLQSMGMTLLCTDRSVRNMAESPKLNPQRMTDALIEAGIHKPLIHHFTTGSTNLCCQQDKRASIHVAEHQSAGRGRRNRQWVSPIGQSIAMSLSHDIDVGLQKLAGLNIVAGVAIAKTAEQFGQRSLQLKWPNDVVGKQGKIAGILIEALGNAHKSRVIIGIGINWAVSDKMLASVQQACMNIDIKTTDRETFLVALVVQLEQLMRHFLKHGLSQILDQWSRYDALKGRMITVFESKQSYPAEYLGIDPDGMLLIQVGDQTKTLASGEVSVRAH